MYRQSLCAFYFQRESKVEVFTYVGEEMVFQGNFVIYHSKKEQHLEGGRLMRIAIDAMGGDHAPKSRR